MPPWPAGMNADRVRVVAVGGCLGAPQALQALLRGLPRGLPVPVLVGLSVAGGFLETVVQRLGAVTGFPVCVAAEGMVAERGRAYFAPESGWLGMREDGRLTVRAEVVGEGEGRRVAGPLFEAVTEVFGAGVIGVLLSGPGDDGAVELVRMRERGAVTIAQDAGSAVVHGMPGEAIRLGGAVHVFSPAQTAAALGGWLGRGG